MPFVLSQGTIERVRPAQSALGFGFQPMALNQAHHHEYEHLYKTQPALRTVVEFLGRNIAELGLDVYERVSDTDRKKVRDHPLAKMLDNPLPGSKWTRYRLINWTVQEYSLFNSAIWLKVRAASGELGVVPIPRRFITPMGENFLAPDHYLLSGSKGTTEILPDNVVHFFGYNPDDIRDGWSPIETLRLVLLEEWHASNYRQALWRNGARISGYISRSEKAPRWTPEARARFKDEWSSYSSEVAAGGTPVLEDGMTWNEGGITPKDAQYIEARQLSREEVAAAYHVDPAVLGLSKNTTQSSLPEIRRMLYSDSFGPLLEMLQQDLERQLLPDLDPSGAANHYVEFNLRKKMQGSFQEQAAAISASVGGPWMTRNEARALVNLPELPEGKDLVVPMNVTAGGLASPRDTAPNNPSNNESNGKPPGPKPIGAGA